jgi:hypothetical protein
MIQALPKQQPVRERVERVRKRATTTPVRLRTLSSTIVAAAIALAVVGTGALLAAEVTVVGIQQRTVPAIVGMQRLHALLSDADRSAANAYLAGGADSTLALWHYTADISAVNGELQADSANNPGGEEASQRLRAIATVITYYTQLMTTASADAQQNLPAGTAYLQASSNLMHRSGSGILAQVDSLRNVYAAGLDRANLTLQITGALLAVYAIAAVVVLVLLFHTQRFLRVRFRRRRNHRLLAATLLLVIVSAGTALGSVRAAQPIRLAESESYTRLLNMWNARALAYDANGNEGLALIVRGGTFDKTFQTATAKLVDRPLTNQLVQDARQGSVRFNGLIADELRAATTGQEQDSAMLVLQAYQAFLQADAAVRDRVAHNDRDGATAIALGASGGQLVFAFDTLDFYLGATIKLIQDQFDATIGSTQLPLEGTLGLQAFVLAIAGLAYWGLRPRMAEYTAGAKRQQAVPA